MPGLCPRKPFVEAEAPGIGGKPAGPLPYLPGMALYFGLSFGPLRESWSMKFDNYHIHEGIKKAISKAGYKRPTDIQYKSIPPILKGEDVLAIAQTGTGKTAAFAIPILHILTERKQKGRPDGLKCLVMVPSHELARQTDQVFRSLGKHSPVRSLAIHGGVDQNPQKEELEKGVDVLIATPGRMFDLVSQGALRLDRLEILVLDEADHMLDMGFIKDIRDLMKHLPKKRQTLFFSATIDDRIKKIAYSLVQDAIRIQISPKDPVARNIDHAVCFIEMDHKRFFLEQIVRGEGARKILVFVRTRVRAERVMKAMERVGIAAETIHSDRSQQEREQVMLRFKKRDTGLLIATDVSARGIDIPGVELVVNYDLPEQADQYIHRVGRTGRGRQRGRAIAFCSPDEKALLDAIEKRLGKTIEQLEIDPQNYERILDTMGDKPPTNWQSLLDEEEAYRKRKKRKR